MTSKPTWMCAYATPPGGIVATFIDKFFEPTFFADTPGLYWMLFQLRQLLLPRMTLIPSPPSTYRFRSSDSPIAPPRMPLKSRCTSHCSHNNSCKPQHGDGARRTLSEPSGTLTPPSPPIISNRSGRGPRSMRHASAGRGTP